MAMIDFKVAKKPHDGLPVDTIVKRNSEQVSVLVAEGYLVPVAPPQPVAPPPVKPQIKE